MDSARVRGCRRILRAAHAAAGPRAARYAYINFRGDRPQDSPD